LQLSPYLIAILASWIVAQGLKYLIIAAKRRSFDHIRQLYLSGNMPSAHSASAVALVTLIGLRDGIEGPVFAVAALFSAVVMYDAIMVRRSVGEQGLAIQALIGLAKNKALVIPRSARGHTPLEVIVGATLGAVIGLIVFFATK
jgi:acid phosphatase family membrane protein YuiD